MKILIDTNVIVDVALLRQPFFPESDQVFKFVEQQRVEGYVSASTMSDLYYIIRKTQGRDWTLRFLQRLTSICQIATVDRSVIEMALAANFADFEDAIQHSTAQRNTLDVIVTRNPEDYRLAALNILTPSALIQTLST